MTRPRDLISAELAAELLALLPDSANFAAIRDSELYLCWPDDAAEWTPGVDSRPVAELEPDDAALPVLAETAAALRTVEWLYGVLAQVEAKLAAALESPSSALTAQYAGEALDIARTTFSTPQPDAEAGA